ncbi:MAG: spinster family MFS transporter [Gammaproteobacteria bacterium]
MFKSSSPFYRHYILTVLIIVYIFNFVDRQIISILAENIRADIGINDSQIGFLYGTAFAVFYAIFGIPLGRLADNWQRRKLISIGLGFWSLMTALSGTARNFWTLSAYRIGVGIGEASATPAALSMLSDYYPKSVRATVMGLYSSGIYIGAGIGLGIGGFVVDNWNQAWPDHSLSPFGLKGWQAAYLSVGLPGILLALLVWTLKEPIRGAIDGIAPPASNPRPFATALRELAAMLPISNLFVFSHYKAPRHFYVYHLVGAALIALLIYTLIAFTGSAAQWLALGLGCYCTLSWMQINSLSDPVGFALMFKTRSYLLSIIGFSCIAFVTYGVGFWGPPFFQRVHGMSVADSGLILGLSAAIGGGVGIILGGIMGDAAKKVHASGGLYLSALVASLALPANLIMLTNSNLTIALIANFIGLLLAPMWIGIATSTVTGLVLPRLRAIASAFYILIVTIIGLGLGPYSIGLMSTLMELGGQTAGAALQYANIYGSFMFLAGAVFLLIAARYLPADEASILKRARQSGENIETS